MFTQFIKFLQNAQGMFEAILNSLEQYKLSIYTVSGINADNINGNFGVNYSLFTNMRALSLDLITENCHAYFVHNCERYIMSFFI